MGFNWKPWFAYTTVRHLKVDYWQVGLAYYLLTLAIAIGYVMAKYRTGLFFESVPITGSVSPFIDTTSHPYAQCKTESDPQTACATTGLELLNKQYCSNANYNYEYDEIFRYYSGAENSYQGPLCDIKDPYTISTKKTNLVTVNTVFMETHRFVWEDRNTLGNCTDENDGQDDLATEAIAACSEPGGVAPTKNSFTNQCECETHKAVFPTAVEEYSIQISHSYTVQGLLSMSGWTHSSENSNHEEHGDIPLDSTFKYPSGEEETFPGGADIKFKIKKLLDEIEVGILDTDNPLGGVDYRQDRSTLPKYRHTGLNIRVEMKYTNLASDGTLRGGGRHVVVEVVPSKVEGSWYSVGPSSFYTTFVDGDLGRRKYHEVVRYPQDIIIEFVPTGTAYGFEWMALIQALVEVIVLTSITRTIMDVVVFYLLPHGVSTVLRNKRNSSTSRKRSFRELGMMAAVSVTQFNALDKEGSGRLSLTELVRIFGKIKNVDEKKALMIAKTILGEERASTLSEGIDFEEFMSISYGDSITFDQFLDLVSHTGGKLHRLSLQAREAAAKEYAEAAKGIELDDAPDEAPTPQPAAQPLPQQPVVSAGNTVMVVPSPVVQPPVQRALPPGVIKIVCHNCKRAFGGPQSAKMVGCPFCQTVNRLG